MSATVLLSEEHVDSKLKAFGQDGYIREFGFAIGKILPDSTILVFFLWPSGLPYGVRLAQTRLLLDAMMKENWTEKEVFSELNQASLHPIGGLAIVGAYTLLVDRNTPLELNEQKALRPIFQFQSVWRAGCAH